MSFPFGALAKGSRIQIHFIDAGDHLARLAKAAGISPGLRGSWVEGNSCQCDPVIDVCYAKAGCPNLLVDAIAGGVRRTLLIIG